jgi:hypothetical protein
VKSKKINVLIVFANPFSTERLRLDTEAREIRRSIERSKYRDAINIVTLQATTVGDLRRALLDQPFQIIHISGHGSDKGLILANDQGGHYLVNPPTLAELFCRYPSIECVLLNACYSSLQGRFLAASIPFTIAMDGPILDNAAIAFTVGFYDALGAGHPIEFAYEEGISSIKLEASPLAKLPKLIRKGETPVTEVVEEQEQLATSERTYIRAGKFLVGFAIDLSGSMNESIRNRTDTDMSRLQSLDQSLGDLINNARASIKESRARNIETSLDLFVYGFGLRTMPVCDLLSLIKAGRELITNEVIKEYEERYKQEAQTKYRGYAGTEDLVRQLGLGGLWSIGENITKKVGESVIVKRILRDMQSAIEARYKQIGDTTISFEEAAQMWNSNNITISNVKELIFGNTPAREVLVELVNRFHRELQQRDSGTKSILFLVSDGKFTNVNPLPLAKTLQSMGVSIVSCFISNQDTANPRVLLNKADPHWELEAQLMFDLSSPMGDLPELRRYLFQHGWIIYPDPKLFVQLNHSDVLKEFVRVTLSMVEDSEAANSLPRGW